ncbi:hypothetical protein WJX73_001037 [Symbiochloris irregularis]|uniref:Uncharacterized protein n=1 Tax=Symbiochloris irregularis TaxID=706552 RepID=A0AAW1NYV8_9CHLO
MRQTDGAARVPTNPTDSAAKGPKETEQQTQLREKLREFQEKKALRRQSLAPSATRAQQHNLSLHQLSERRMSCFGATPLNDHHRPLSSREPRQITTTMPPPPPLSARDRVASERGYVCHACVEGLAEWAAEDCSGQERAMSHPVTSRLAAPSQTKAQEQRNALLASAMRVDLARLQAERAQAKVRRQKQESEQQLRRGLDRVQNQQRAAIQQELKLKNMSMACAAEQVVSQQLEVLEKWAAVKDQQRAGMRDLKAALTSVLSQVPVINGATCGPSPWEVDQQGLVKELKAVQQALSTLQKLLPGACGTGPDGPAVQSGDLSEPAELGGASGMQALADDVTEIVEVKAKMQEHMARNAELLDAKKGLATEIQSLTLQLLTAE